MSNWLQRIVLEMIFSLSAFLETTEKKNSIFEVSKIRSISVKSAINLLRFTLHHVTDFSVPGLKLP